MQNRTFLITGYPRSRTTWLANAMTTDKTFCYHDGIRLVNRLTDLPRLLGAHAIGGDADSGLLPFFPDVDRLFPQARWVLVERDQLQCITSFYRSLPELAFRDIVWKTMEHNIFAMKQRLGTRLMIVPYEKMDDPFIGRDIWEHCTGRLRGFQWARWKMLCEWNTQPIHEKEIASATPIMRKIIQQEMRG